LIGKPVARPGGSSRAPGHQTEREREQNHAGQSPVAPKDGVGFADERHRRQREAETRERPPPLTAACQREQNQHRGREHDAEAKLIEGRNSADHRTREQPDRGGERPPPTPQNGQHDHGQQQRVDDHAVGEISAGAN
jgi:hypothetical protein